MPSLPSSAARSWCIAGGTECECRMRIVELALRSRHSEYDFVKTKWRSPARTLTPKPCSALRGLFLLDSSLLGAKLVSNRATLGERTGAFHAKRCAVSCSCRAAGSSSIFSDPSQHFRRCHNQPAHGAARSKPGETPPHPVVRLSVSIAQAWIPIRSLAA